MHRNVSGLSLWPQLPSCCSQYQPIHLTVTDNTESKKRDSTLLKEDRLFCNNNNNNNKNNMTQYAISCHCGAAAQTVTFATNQVSPETAHHQQQQQGISLCHCHDCRHNTGILCVSYVPIGGSPPSTRGLVAYKARLGAETYFCATCGCHVFICGRGRATLEGASSLLGETENDDDPGKADNGGGGSWAVATGVISGKVEENHGRRTGSESELAALQYMRHVNVGQTKDGGLSPFIKEVDGRKLDMYMGPGPDSHGRGGEVLTSDQDAHQLAASHNEDSHAETRRHGKPQRLHASCHCGGVKFHITRPNEASRQLRSPFSDLIVPFHALSPRATNPGDEKWWLVKPARGDAGETTKYLAGACACRSCRLVSGFEVQTWAFVPRANIFFHRAPAEGGGDDDDVPPLDFATLPVGKGTDTIPLRRYESSSGVLREFCGRCGATVFWHDRWRRPDLVDVSVGLLYASEGARADEWLEWCAWRVSFAEEAGTGRMGEVERGARGLIAGLEMGLRSLHRDGG